MNIDKIKAIIAEHLSVETDEITLDSLLQEDLGADSLDAVEIIMAIEEEFDVEIADEEAKNIKTVKDIVDYLENNS